MKIDVIVDHKKYQPEVEGLQYPPDSYVINITRSDGRGISKMEALTAMNTAVEGLQDSIRTAGGFIGKTYSKG